MDLLLTNFQQIGNALGWALIHFVWQGLILVASYYAITRLFFKNKIHFHYWTGIIFIVLSLIIPIKEFIHQLLLSSDLNSTTVHQLASDLPVFVSTGILSPVDMIVSLIQKFIPYLVSIWTIVIILISSNLARSWYELIKLSKDNPISVPANLMKALERNSKTLKLKFKPIISISCQVVIPATFGFFKPVILFPASLISQLPQDQMEAILLHELCHIKRSDFIHNILQLLVETLFFYHPFTKWMSADIRKIREQCCDKLVLTLETKPILYAKALTNIASILNKGKITNKATSKIQVAVNDGELYNRIRLVMSNKTSKLAFPNLLLAFLSLFLLYFTLMSFTHNSPSLHLSPKKNLALDTLDTKESINRPMYTIPEISNLHGIEVNKFKQSEHKTKKASRNTQDKVFLNQTKFSLTSSREQLTQIPNEEKLYALPEIEKKSLIANKFIDDKYKNYLTKETNSAVKNSSLPLLSKYESNNLSFKQPKIIKKVMPNYNRRARAMRAEGTVILSFNIDNKGKVKNINLDKNSKPYYLGSIARQALRQWRFDVDSLDETNTAHRYQQVFSFELDNNTCFSPITGTRIRNKECKRQYNNTENEYNIYNTQTQ